MTGVPEDSCTKGEPAQLLQILHSIAKQTGSKEDEQNAHDTEKDPVIQPITHAIHEETEDESSQQTKGGAKQEQQAVCLERESQRENGCFQALSANRNKGKQAKRKTRTGNTGFSRNLLLQQAAMLLHPECHGREQNHSDQIRNGLKDGLKC